MGTADRPDENGEFWSSRATRRQFLQAAGVLAGGAALATASCAPFTTGSSPSKTTAKTRSYRSRPDLAIPILTTVQKGEPAAGLIFVAPGGPLIVDNAGNPIWFLPVSGKNVADFRVQTYRRSPVLTWWEGKVGVGYGLSGELVIADSSYNEVKRIAAGHPYEADLHEFQITPRDTVLLTAYNVVPSDLSSVGGSPQGQVLDGIVQELDIATGQVLFEWHSLGHVALSESHASYTKGQPFDYFHINSIDLDADGNLLISARNTWAVYKIDRASGAVLWRMGGRKSDFTMGYNTPFAWQHDARRQPDGSITLFDDEAAPKVEAQSRGLVLDADEASMTLTLRKAYTHAPGILASSQGNMQVLPNGNVLVGWGSQPNLTEFDAGGRVVLDGTFAGTFQSYRAYRLPWVGKPSGSPAIATVKSNGATTVYASWNGATEIARWQVVAGQEPSSLQPVGSHTRDGFETAIRLPDQPSYVAVRALDASGAVLGTSSLAAA
jgi:Arylsulfotransferase (ASST)